MIILVVSSKRDAVVGVLMWLAIIIIMAPPITATEGLSRNRQFGKLRTEALEELFPGVLDYAEALDRFAIGFVDYRDPLETMSWITMYLPGVVFMTAVIAMCIPHVLNFLIFLPKMWFFSIPCLYHFKQSVLRKRRDSDGVMGECNSGDLAHITRQVYNSLLRMANIQEPQKSRQTF